jgi:hypothetical protein
VCPRHVRNRVCACASGAFAVPRLLRCRSDVHMGPAMSDHEEPIRLADAAVRRLHDLFDVMRAIAAARRLVGESIREYRKSDACHRQPGRSSCDR